MCGVAATQVILAAIAASDGTRKGVNAPCWAAQYHCPGRPVGHRQGNQDRSATGDVTRRTSAS
jgi:hypothetical protein